MGQDQQVVFMVSPNMEVMKGEGAGSGGSDGRQKQDDRFKCVATTQNTAYLLYFA